MKRIIALATFSFLLLSCGQNAVRSTGGSLAPDQGWLFLEKGPYTLATRVEAAPGPATFELVKDLSLMADEPEVVFRADVEVAPDSTIVVDEENGELICR